ncbi:MAG: FG-GAP repeat domain-containing protein [Victivallaceae bacterium]
MWYQLPGVIAMLLAAAAAPPPTVSDRDLLLAADFESGRDADFACGNPAAVMPEALRRTAPGGTLKLPWNQWFCYTAPGNLELEAGTIVMRVKLDFQPGKGTLPEGWTDSHLFAVRNRTGQRLNALISDKSGFLFFYASNTEGKASSVKVDVRDWKANEWRTVTCGWERPGKLFLAVEGLGEKSVKNADLPVCPVAALYDIYIGSNSQVLPIQQYGRLNTLRGEIDELRIYRKYLPCEFAAPPAFKVHNPVETFPAGVKSPVWAIPGDRKRINYFLKPTIRRWEHNPVTLKLNLGAELANLPPAGLRNAIASLRLVQFDPATGESVVYNAKATGDERISHPFQLDTDFTGNRGGTLHFVHSGALPAAYSVYFAPGGEPAKPCPAEYPLTGTGEPVMSGVKGVPGSFGGALRGAFDTIDFDGDGDLDLFFLSGSQTDSGRDLFGGLYYYENLRNERGYDVFAAPVLIDKGNQEFGIYRQTAPPRLVDLDGDGRKECVFASDFLAACADIENRNGFPVLTNWRKLDFDGEMPKLVSSPALADFDGDGLTDIFSDGELYRNVGTRTAPKFSSKAADVFAPGVRGDDEQSNHKDVHAQKIIRNNFGENIRPLVWAVADLNGDGRADLVCCGWRSQLYYFPRRADGKFAAPVLIRTRDGHELFWPGVFPYMSFADLDGDGATDMLLSSEDGTLGFARNVGAPGKAMEFLPPVSLSEMNPRLNAGALAIPVAVDWNGDGALDLVAGAANGFVWYFENAGTSVAPVFRNPVPLEAGNRPIRIMAGPDGSVQGEQENDWGYLNIEVADWDGDGLKDLFVTGVRGEHLFFRNVGTRRDPRLAPAEFLEVDWEGEAPHPGNIRFQVRGKALVTAHRCRPSAVDFDGDGLVDYVTTDHDDKLAFYQRYRRPDGLLGLKPGKNIFTIEAPFFRTMIWNHQTIAGLPVKSAQEGRSVIQVLDWDNDGLPDILMDNLNGRILRNTSADRLKPVLVDQGDLAGKRLANHNAAPYAADFDGDGKLDLIVGAETGWIYYFSRPYLEKDTPGVIASGIEEKTK